MNRQAVGILHPGEMGVAVAAAAKRNGQVLLWASEGRSAATRRRAREQGLVDAGTVPALCAKSRIILSVCPPHAAEAVAHDVAAQGFTGVYVDANAISPARSVAIGEAMDGAGIAYVDGGIIGGPPWEAGSTTCLYLSGPRAADVADCFAAGPLKTRVLGEAVGMASALKLCYAAYSKGTTALLAAILAAAETSGVRAALYDHWTSDDPAFAARTNERVRRVTAKAWRFEGEMDEIAATFGAAGLPEGFHLAAADIYHRLSDFKDAPAPPALDTVLAALLESR